jgi:PAS domain S-box-containing protein
VVARLRGILDVVKKPIRVLVVEDSEFDARILIGTLKQGGYDPVWKRVESASTMRDALQQETWEVVLSDYNLPEFSAPDALRLLQESGLDLPFVIISGGIGEDVAVAAMKAGAHDYLMKGNLARLVPAVEREMREAEVRHGRRRAEEALRDSEQRYRLLWENSTDAVLLMGEGQQIQFANPAVLDVFGHEPGEVVGWQFQQLIDPEMREDVGDWIAQHLDRAGGRVRQQPMETLGCHQSGRQVLIEIAFTQVTLKGERLIVAFIRDITERRRAELELQANEEQFRVARDIQERLFPTVPPRLPGIEIAGRSEPASAAGGDYFDYLPMLRERWGVVVGDVTGHGIGPALLMAETRAYLRVLAMSHEDLGGILTHANQLLAEDIGVERFITMLLVSLDPVTHRLCYANAGHPEGYVLDARGHIKVALKRTGVPLGIHPDTKYPPAQEVQLDAGDIVVLLTDGIDEAVSPDEQLFGTERMLAVLRERPNSPAAELVEALYREVKEFSGDTPQLDDATAVVVRVL